MIQAVLWDFGGVFTTSPFDAFRRYEKQHGLPRDFIRGVNSRNPDHNAWARFERGEIGGSEFDRSFAEESASAGHRVRGADVLALLAGDLRPEMLEALRRCRPRLKTACLTNNFRPPAARAPTVEPEHSSLFDRVRSLFDVVIESSVIGYRKPDPKFYGHALEALGVDASDCVFLDDLGINLKPARAMGMHTIKVSSPEQALGELEALVGIALRAVPSLDRFA